MYFTELMADFERKKKKAGSRKERRRGSATEVNSKEADTENMKGFFMRKERETFDENQTIRKNERFH